MTYDSMYKDFVAKAATRVFAEMMGTSLDKHEFNIFGKWDDHADKIHHIARMAAKGACALASELEDEWCCQEQNSAFFDPDDTSTTGIQDELAHVGNILANLKDMYYEAHPYIHKR